MTTYNNGRNGLMFFSCKCFLESVDTIFHFRWVANTGSSVNRYDYETYVLEFKPVDEDVWQRKPVNICLLSNYIHLTPPIESYTITNHTNTDDDEIVDYFKVKDLLHNLLIVACDIKEPNTVYREKLEANRLYFIKPPFRFKMQQFPEFEKQQGKVSIRISNGSKYTDTDTCFLFWTFNSWKYIMKGEAIIKKRKLEAAIEPETKSIEVVPEEIKSEI